jgi:hypothetical protein
VLAQQTSVPRATRLVLHPLLLPPLPLLLLLLLHHDVVHRATGLPLGGVPGLPPMAPEYITFCFFSAGLRICGGPGGGGAGAVTPCACCFQLLLLLLGAAAHRLGQFQQRPWWQPSARLPPHPKNPHPPGRST